MKAFLIMSLIAQFVFASQNASGREEKFATKLEESTATLESLIESEIGNNNTCLDEYLAREKQLKRWLIWTPPLALAGVPAGTYAGLAAGAGLAHLINAGGWNAIGYAIGGGLVGFGASVLTFVSVEAVSGVRFYKNRKMIHLVAESNANDLEGANVNKYLNKYRNAFPSDSIDIETFTQAIRDFDSSGRLCDGSMIGNTNPQKLKYMLAGKWELFNAIHKEYAQSLAHELAINVEL